MTKSKTCKKCSIEKELSEFPINDKKYRLHTCKLCVYERAKIRVNSQKWKQKASERVLQKGEKKCINCGDIKSFDFFHKNPLMKTGRCNECKKCHHQRVKIIRANPAMKKKISLYQRRSGIKHRYGLNEDEYNKMVSFQMNKCLICENTPNPNGAFQNQRLHIDHCHKSGKIRGLLCHLCNRGIGLFRERIDLIEKTLQYLKIHA